MRQVEFLWMLGSACNYDCSYCSFSREGMREWLLKSERHYSLEQWVSAWEAIHRRYGSARIHITGAGEPTLVPGFTELLARLTLLHFVRFDTNLSWPLSFWRTFSERVGTDNLFIEASFHPEMETADAFIEKLRFLRDRGHSYNCRIVAYPALFDRLEGYRRLFGEHRLRCMLTPYLGNYGGRRYPSTYTAAERERILGAAGEESERPVFVDQTPLMRHLLEVAQESPRGKLCRSGYDYACIMPDGTVHRCRRYALQELPALGTFIDGRFELSRQPAVCISNQCDCEYRLVSEPDLAPAGAGARERDG